MGAIFSLHYLACKNAIYRSAVHKIFCAFLRSVHEYASDIEHGKEAISFANDKAKDFSDDATQKTLPEDKQAILNLIVNNQAEREIYKEYKVNLKRANLAFADLAKANLRGVQLSYANLSFANLYRADLSEAVLYRTNLKEVQGIGLNLSDAYVGGANFAKANLRDAVLKNIDSNSINF